MRTRSRTAAGLAGDLPVLLVAVVWGSSYLAAKNLATEDSVAGMLVLRFGVVLPLFGLAVRRALRRLGAAELRGGALLGTVLAVVFLLETYGVVHTSATNAGLIISLTMVFTPLAESLVSRTPLPRAFTAAAVLSVLGVVLLTWGGGFTAPSAGDLLMLGAAVVRTAHVLVMHRRRALRKADPLALTWVQLASATVVFALLAPFTGKSPVELAGEYGTEQWLNLLYLSAFCTLFAFLVQMWAVRRTSPSRVSLLLGTEPLWAAVFGVALAGDRPGAAGLAGMVLVLAGTEWGRRTAAPAPSPAQAPPAAQGTPPAARTAPATPGAPAAPGSAAPAAPGVSAAPAAAPSAVGGTGGTGGTGPS
ncbi:DMT family transporter [Streptomyces thermolineatus]|uniref:DMT family transporter n=1 Tax=Streptomyces thermolineatus TaxID=44033 RepID=A0ABP5ZVU6_9ACTN